MAIRHDLPLLLADPLSYEDARPVVDMVVTDGYEAVATGMRGTTEAWSSCIMMMTRASGGGMLRPRPTLIRPTRGLR